MKDEEIIALAKECGADDIGTSDTYVSVKLNGHFVFSPDDLIAFARAIADLQKGERAVICKNCGAIYWVEVSQCDCAVGVETQWEEVKVIRSPETDLDEALRRQ